MTELEPEPGLLAPNPVLFLLHITTIKKKKIPPAIQGPEVLKLLPQLKSRAN